MSTSRQDPSRPADHEVEPDVTILSGAQVLTATGWDTTDLKIDSGTIAAIGRCDPPPVGATVIDVRGLRVAPGFVDLQINGGFGHDFTQDPGTIWDVGGRLAEFGVTAFLPTIITSPPSTVIEAQRVIAQGPPRGYRGATAIGLHVEGPMLSPEKPGTHDPRHLAEPAEVAIENWSPETGVRMVTLAPELPGALDVITALAGRGVTVSVGHSNATHDEAAAGFRCGATMATHLYNAMSPLDHRAPGLVGAILAESAVAAGVIVDGIHSHPAAVRVAWQAKGLDRFVLITDAMAAMGMGYGRFFIGSVDVCVDEAGPRNSDGVLAGSVLTMDTAVRNLMRFTACSPAAAITAAATSPAKAIGDASRGVLEVGRRADVVVLGPELEVELTLVGGYIAYRRPAGALPR